MYTLVNLLVLCLAVSTYAGSLTPHIVGGDDAPIGKYPYQVSLRLKGNHVCGGSIIDKRYILTAAHCVKFVKDRYSELSIHAGTNFVREEGIKYDVERIIVHERFRILFIMNDIALIRVTKDIEYNDLVQPITLDTENVAQPDDTAVLTGWGRLSFRGPIAEKLQEIELKIVSQTRCRIPFLLVTSKQVCTLTERGEGACNGDSGGPLVINGVQVGVVSFGLPCARGRPDVYTRVYAFRDWIKENMH